MKTIVDLQNFITQQMNSCWCSAQLFDSEYTCPFCFRFDMYLLSLHLLEIEYL